MDQCNIVTKSGKRCQKKTSLVENLHLYTKKSTAGRTFKLGEVWELKNNNNGKFSWLPSPPERVDSILIFITSRKPYPF